MMNGISYGTTCFPALLLQEQSYEQCFPVYLAYMGISLLHFAIS